MKILTEDEDDHQHHQHQDVEESHPPSLTYRLDQDNIAPAATEYHYDDEYYDDEESSRERRGGCSISRNRKDICTAIICFHGCYKTPKSRHSTVIIKVDGLINDDDNVDDDDTLSHQTSAAYVVICRSFLIFVMLAIMTIIILVNSTTTTQTSGATQSPPSPPPPPPPTSELLASSSSSTSSILHPMDGEPYSDGEYHYEGIGHNVLEPHISSSSSSSSNSSSSAEGVVAAPPPTSTPLLHSVIMDGEPHPEGEYHYESVGHTILPIDDSSTSYPPSSNISNSTSISQNMVVVPFSYRYNLYFDGILFIKNATTHYSQQQQQQNPNQQQEQEQPPNNIFNSYAKTIDPVTEIHFSPGESTTTKQIILSTNPPDLSYNNNRIFNQQQFLLPTSTSTSSMIDIEENAAITIGLQSNGDLWLPRSNTNDDDSNNNNSNNNNVLYHDDANKEMYGAGDQFVLKIMNANDNDNDSKSKSNSRIRLYRNNNELVGEWRNPYPDSTKLYAQIWLKDPNSSMFAYALNNNNKVNKEEEEGSSGSNGQNYRQRTLLRGRKDYF